LHSRLDRLEARNRLLAVALLVILGLCALAFGCAASSPVQDVVRAKAFEVVDANGKLTAKLGTLPDGSAGLVLHDASGERRALLSTDTDSAPGLYLYDASGNRRALLTTRSDGSPGLYLWDDIGNVRTVLGTFADGSSGLALCEASGIIRAMLCTTELVLWDASGREMFSAP